MHRQSDWEWYLCVNALHKGLKRTSNRQVPWVRPHYSVPIVHMLFWSFSGHISCKTRGHVILPRLIGLHEITIKLYNHYFNKIINLEVINLHPQCNIMTNKVWPLESNNTVYIGTCQVNHLSVVPFDMFNNFTAILNNSLFTHVFHSGT